MEVFDHDIDQGQLEVPRRLVSSDPGMTKAEQKRRFLARLDNPDRLWKFNAGSGARGGPVSYAVNGKQYIAIPTGLGSHAPGFLTGAFPQIRNLPGGAALMVFTVD